MKDKLGVEILPGCHIAYPLTYGRSAILAIYEVREVGGNWITAKKVEKEETILYDGIEQPIAHFDFKHVGGPSSGLEAEYRYVRKPQSRIDRLKEKVVTLTRAEHSVVLIGYGLKEVV